MYVSVNSNNVILLFQADPRLQRKFLINLEVSYGIIERQMVLSKQ